MLRFEKETLLPVTAREAFDWHSRPGAFERLSPPWQRIEVIEPATLADGTRLVFRLYQGPIPIRWVAEHTHFEPGRMFRDVQVVGPLARWEHTHRVEPAGPDAAWLEDRVIWALPFGWLGAALAGRLARRRIARMFEYRHRVTRDAFTGS